MTDRISTSNLRLDRRDLLAVVVLALLVATVIWRLQAQADPRFLADPAGNDVWFEADQPTVADRMLHRWNDQSRNAHHPLFPLLGTVPVYVLTAIKIAEPVALRVVVVAFGVLWSATVYVLLRGIVPRRTDALVFTALAHVTAAAMFWVPVPETYSLGSASVMAMLVLCAWDPAGRRHEAWYVAAAAFSLAVTTPNWLTGLAGLVTRHRLGRALQMAANSLCIVVVLWTVQHAIFPTANFFLGSSLQQRFVLPHGSAGIPTALRAAFVHSIVMPRIAVVPEPKWGLIMSVQESPIGSSGPLGVAATIVWAMLLLIGAWALVTQRHAMRAPLALALLGHATVDATYGEETFLYALLVAPVLVAVVALAANTRLRAVVLVLAAMLTVLLAANNSEQLSTARRFFERPAPVNAEGATAR